MNHISQSYQRSIKIKALAPIVLAALCEIAGGYLTLLGLKEESILVCVITVCLLFFGYGIFTSRVTDDAGRIVGACWGFFILLALLRSWTIDGIEPSIFVISSSATALLGAVYIVYTPKLIIGNTLINKAIS